MKIHQLTGQIRIDLKDNRMDIQLKDIQIKSIEIIDINQVNFMFD